MIGIGYEWGSGANDGMQGNGFRINLNPFDTMDFYCYSEEKVGNLQNRIEGGWYINTALVEAIVAMGIFVVPAIVGALSVGVAQIVTAFGAVAGITIILNLLGDDNMEINSCEGEG